MNAYAPTSTGVPVAVGALAAAVAACGYLLPRFPGKRGRRAAWVVAMAAVAASERLVAAEPAGTRMLALIAVLFVSMKGIVAVEAPPLSCSRWLAFVSWAGMRPQLFARPAPADEPVGVLPGAGALAARGAAFLVAGTTLAVATRLALAGTTHRVAATLLLLLALSLALHFGLLTLAAAFWRFRGIDARAPFRDPLGARSLGDFWRRRWNVGFSEMLALAVRRPLAPIGARTALLAAFLVSGVLHELAISLPVRAGYGLPTLYFVLQGVGVLAERRLSWRAPGSRRSAPSGPPGRAWTAAWLLLPLPLVFHVPFLRGVVWPLAGLADTP